MLFEVGGIFNVRDVTPTSRLELLGANSEQMLCLVAKLKRQFSITVATVDAFTAETVADLVALTRT